MSCMGLSHFYWDVSREKSSEREQVVISSVNSCKLYGSTFAHCFRDDLNRAECPPYSLSFCSMNSKGVSFQPCLHNLLRHLPAFSRFFQHYSHILMLRKIENFCSVLDLGMVEAVGKMVDSDDSFGSFLPSELLGHQTNRDAAKDDHRIS